MLSISNHLLACRGHPGIAKYCTVWATFGRYYLLDAFSLTCTIQMVSVYIRHHSSLLANYKLSQQLDYRENWIYAYRMHKLSHNDYPSSIDKHHFC